MKYTYNKLVRDKIPENINSMEGRKATYLVEVEQDKADEREEQEMKKEWRKNDLVER